MGRALAGGRQQSGRDEVEQPRHQANSREERRDCGHASPVARTDQRGATTGPVAVAVERQDIGAEDTGWINAATNADEMLTEEWRGKIATLTPANARRFILSALEENIRQMTCFPVKPPS